MRVAYSMLIGSSLLRGALRLGILMAVPFLSRAQDFSRFPAHELFVPQISFPSPGPRFTTGDEACAAIADVHNANGAGTPYRTELRSPSYGENGSYGKGCFFDTVYFGGFGGYPEGTVIRSFAQNAVLPTYVCPAEHNGVAGPNGEQYCERRTIAPKECNDRCPATEAGNPIDFAANEKVYRTVDIAEVDGLEFRRTYRSRFRELWHSRLGPSWFSSHFRQLTFLGSGAEPVAISVIGTDGRPVMFMKNAANRWIAEGDQLATSLYVQPGGAGYEVRRPNGDVEWYDAAGALSDVYRVDGTSLHYIYDAGLLKEVRNQKGRSLHFAYDPKRRLISVRSGAGQVTTFAYTSTGLLQSAAASGYIERYSYEAHLGVTSYLTRVESDQLGLIGQYAYNSQGIPVSTQKDGGVDAYAVDYSVPGRITVTDPLGRATVYFFRTLLGNRVIDRVTTTCQQCTSETVEYVRDANLNVLDQRGDDARTCRRFDVSRNLEIWRAEGVPLSQDCSGAGAVRIVQTTWHPDFRLPTSREMYGADGQLRHRSSWTYNPRGQVLTATESDPITGETRSTVTSYCEADGVSAGTCPMPGLIQSVDGPRTDVNDIVAYTYRMADDPACAGPSTTCSWRKGDLWKVTNAQGQVTETLAYDGSGRVLSTKDADGVVTELAYDLRGRLTSRTTRGAN